MKLEALWVDGDKYMWDGDEPASREEAEARAAVYAAEGFETQIVGSDGGCRVYTRRVVTEIELEDAAPV
ncbi:MAG: hypothetical protein JSW65_07070 [Candidatus Bipolaricaulota bacterium]|nr:MAG: hypothetical protein JSW65_07070 [Candidatus Bipolaricaulota bacterium]